MKPELIFENPVNDLKTIFFVQSLLAKMLKVSLLNSNVEPCWRFVGLEPKVELFLLGILAFDAWILLLLLLLLLCFLFLVLFDSFRRLKLGDSDACFFAILFFL